VGALNLRKNTRHPVGWLFLLCPILPSFKQA
jgi:hypothetical protein